MEQIDYKLLEIRDIEIGQDYMIVGWNHQLIGFGEVVLGTKDGRQVIDDETMGIEFVQEVLKKVPAAWLAQVKGNKK